MKNNDTNKKLTVAERMAMEAEAAGLLAQRRKLLAFLKEDDAAKEEVTAKVTEVPEKEEEVTAEVTEVPEKEEEVTAEVTEVPEKEEEATAEVTEIPEKEEEATAEVTEIPEKEEVTAEVTKDSIEEDDSEEPFNFDDWNTEKKSSDSEKPKVTTLVFKTPAKEESSSDGNATAQNENKKVKKNKKSKDFDVIRPILIAFAIVLLAAILICTMLPVLRKEDSSDDTQQPSTNAPADTQPPVDVPDNSVDQKFAMAEFKESVVNIAAQLTDDEDINANIDIFIENIGEDKLVELIEKHGELNVQKAIAEILSFVPEVKMMQYIANNELNYNPNVSEDYDSKLQELKSAYVAATGKNPDGVLMSLEGYEINKSNRAAMEAMILETGDTALLEWYKAKSEAFDTMMDQNRDNQTAEAYKNEVKLELVNSEGTIDFLALQLEKEVSGELNVMDNVSMKYTEAYNQFVLNNYIYVIAK